MTISPTLLEELKKSTAPVPKKLDAYGGGYFLPPTLSQSSIWGVLEPCRNVVAWLADLTSFPFPLLFFFHCSPSLTPFAHSLYLPFFLLPIPITTRRYSSLVIILFNHLFILALEPIEKVSYIDNEPEFRWTLLQDQMAFDKLHEGIKKFAEDGETLKATIRQKLSA